jgi:hypothetical protein
MESSGNRLNLRVILRLTVGRSVSMSWCRAPSRAHDKMVVNCLIVTVLYNSGALSDERSGLFSVSQRLKSLSICTLFSHLACLTCFIYTIYTSPSSVQARTEFLRSTRRYIPDDRSNLEETLWEQTRLRCVCVCDKQTNKQTNSVAFSLQTNYTD